METPMSDIRELILQVMAEGVAKLLPSFNEETGRFLSEPDGPPTPGAKAEDIGWCVMNQDILYPLAVLYTTPGTRLYQDGDILDKALRAGDAIRDFQEADGRVEFLKIDGSRWGPTYMGWTNYAWLEAYALLGDRLSEARRERWETGLILAHDGQAREISDLHVHNIPCWKAMSCYRAGQLMGRPDWQEAGTAMIDAVLAEQQPGGYWAEHGGPSTLYNHVYIHGLGLYYTFSGDERLLPALQAAADFHQTFMYPSGAPVETVDGRVKYHGRIMVMGWVGLSACPHGRRLVRYLSEHLDAERDLTRFQGGAIASAVQHLIAGDEAPIGLDSPASRQPYQDWALVCREGAWFACLSAFTPPPPASRWGQDRQAFLSLWHDRFGLILGGGNSKNQPEWSNFVADGRFVPDKGELLADGSGVTLTYGKVRCSLRLQFEDGKAVIEGTAEGGPAVQQFVVRTSSGDTIHSAEGKRTQLDDAAVQWPSSQLGAWLEVNGCRIAVPSGARFSWPSSAFNPYAADGVGPYGSEVGILAVRLDGKPARWEVSL